MTSYQLRLSTLLPSDELTKQRYLNMFLLEAVISREVVKHSVGVELLKYVLWILFI